MSSHNLNEKEIQKYISTTLQHWGINYIDTNRLKAAKNNETDVLPHLKKLVFDLCILHLVNYEFTIDELQIQFHPKNPLIQDLIMAHLCEIGCPLLMRDKDYVGFSFDNSRELLLVSGWLMGVSDMFGKIGEKLIPKRLKQIQAQSLNIKPMKANHQKNKYGRLKNLDIDSISSLYKVWKNRQFKVQNMERKQKKLKERWRKTINNYNKNNGTNATLEMFLSEGSGPISHKEEELLHLLDYEKQTLSQRKYFWIWLQQKIIKKQMEHLKQTYPQEEVYPEVKDFDEKIQVDPDYLVKFVRKSQELIEEVDELNMQIQAIEDDLNIKNPKNHKMIERQVNDELKKLHEQMQHIHLQDAKPSFVGAQLKKYLKKQGFIQQNKTKKQRSFQQDNNCEQRLKEGIESFISQIDTIKFI